MANTVDDLTLAVALIGRAGLAALAAQVPPADDNLDPLRLRAARAAQIAAALSDRSGLAPIGPAFTASAVGTVGAIAMACVAPDKYRMLDSALALADLYKAEEGVFAQSHPATGGALAVHWGLPGILKDAIETITPRPDTSVRAGLAALTRKLADNPAPGDDVLAPFERVIRALGLNAAAVKETAAQAVAD
jgi:HD-like signal output (HDOD) protein